MAAEEPSQSVAPDIEPPSVLQNTIALLLIGAIPTVSLSLPVLAIVPAALAMNHSVSIQVSRRR